MKTTSPLTAVLFLGLATAVGAAAWLLSGSTPDEDVAAPIERPSTERSGVGFMAVSPKEQRKQANLEATKRQLKRIAEVGEEVSPGLYMIRDSSGDPTYYSTDLIEGRGRNGEPLFMTAEFKKVHTVPLRDSSKGLIASKTRLNPKAPKASLSFGKKKGGGAGTQSQTGGGTTSGGDGSGGDSSGGDGGAAGGGEGGSGPKTLPGGGDG
ncbi:MAG: hypothetical protein ACYTG2_04960 [Planctomycetota bacterium]